MSEAAPNPSPSERVRERFRRVVTSDAGTRLRPSKPEGAAARSATEGLVSVGTGSVGRADYLALKGELQQRMLDELGPANLTGGEERVAEAVRDYVSDMLEAEELPLNTEERARLADDLVEEAMGVGPLAALLVDPAVTDVLVNGPHAVYVERYGKLELTDVRFRDNDHLLRVIERIAMRVGRRIDVSAPMLDARLPDGSRVNATVPPISLDGPTLSIRRFGKRRLRRADLQRLRMVSPEILIFLEHVVRARKNMLISGGTGAGKSTLLGALAEAISNHERIITIEDTAELLLDQEHVVRLETRPANIEGQGRIVARDLVVNALRMRPDRIIVGEVRAAEALDMLQAMNTGHEGSMSTIHSNSPRDALARLETMVLMAGVELPSRAIREQISSALQLVVHVRRYEDGVRRVESVAEVTGMEGGTILMQEIFRFQRQGRMGRSVVGVFEATGVVPRVVEEIQARGDAMPLSIFRKTAESFPD